MRSEPLTLKNALLALGVLGAIALCVVFFQYVATPAISQGLDYVTADTPTEANKACAETFGENYEYAGYMAGNPPVMHCDGPGGKAYMDMPESVAENMNINATAYHD